jgi:hypothetical protein
MDLQVDARRLDQAISRTEIVQLLARYSRGIDRCDVETLRTIWWPEAQVDYGTGMSSAMAWSDNVVASLSRMHRTQHLLGNMIIDVDGDRGTAETYCCAYHELDRDGVRLEMVVGGRYLDKLERRNGEWRVLERRYVMDWNRNVPSTHQEDGFYDHLSRRGGRKPDDPFYSGK